MSYDWLQVACALNGVPVPPRHTILSVNGFLGDMWTGYPAIVAQAMDDEKVEWQPIGWTNSQLPMTHNIIAGVDEAINQINLHPGTFAMAVYSEGAILGSLVMDELRKGYAGRLPGRLNDFIGAVAFGNPRREMHSRAPGYPDPSGHGIARDRVIGTPDTWWDYSDPGDMYTCTPDDQEGDFITSCYQAIAQSNLIGGSDTLEKEILQLLEHPASNVIPLGEAIFKAIGFFGSGVAAHVNYHDRSAKPGWNTYLTDAINHMFDCVNSVEPR